MVEKVRVFHFLIPFLLHMGSQSPSSGQARSPTHAGLSPRIPTKLAAGALPLRSTAWELWMLLDAVIQSFFELLSSVFQLFFSFSLELKLDRVWAGRVHHLLQVSPMPIFQLAPPGAVRNEL